MGEGYIDVQIKEKMTGSSWEDQDQLVTNTGENSVPIARIKVKRPIAFSFLHLTKNERMVTWHDLEVIIQSPIKDQMSPNLVGKFLHDICPTS